MGYWRAGFDVIGVDQKPQPRYPFPFWQADAMELMRDANELRKFDAIHASPPCQAFTLARNNGCHPDAPNLIPETRSLLRAIGVPFVIENVMGAPLINPVRICGSTFALGGERHGPRAASLL